MLRSTGLQRTHLRKQGVIVHTVSPEIFTLGLTSASTTFGNTVPTYDRERTLCDVIRQRGAMDVQTYQTAIREYMLHGHKNLPHLIQCSRALKVEDDVRRYLEVLFIMIKTSRQLKDKIQKSGARRQLEIADSAAAPT